MTIRDILFSDENPEFYTPVGHYAPENFDSVVQDNDREFSWEDFHWTLFYVYDKYKEKIVPFEPVYTDKIESVKYPYADSYHDKRVIRISLDETKKKLDELDSDEYESLIGKTFHFLSPEKINDGESVIDSDFRGGKYYWTEIDGKKFLFDDYYKCREFHGEGFRDIKAYYDKKGEGEIVATLGFDGNISIWTVLKEYRGKYKSVLEPLERIYKSDDIYDISFFDNRGNGTLRGARNEHALTLVINGKRASAIICYDKKGNESKLYSDKIFPNCTINRLAGTQNYFLVKDTNGSNTVYYLNHEKLIKKKDCTSSIPRGELVVMENLFKNCKGTLIYSFEDKRFYAVDEGSKSLIIFKLSPFVELPTDILGNTKEERIGLYYDEDSNSLSATFRAAYSKYGRKCEPISYVLGVYKEDGYHPIQEEINVTVGIYRNGKFHYNKGFPSSSWLSLDSDKKRLISSSNVIEINKVTFNDLIEGKLPENDYDPRP